MGSDRKNEIAEASSQNVVKIYYTQILVPHVLMGKSACYIILLITATLRTKLITIDRVKEDTGSIKAVIGRYVQVSLRVVCKFQSGILNFR